MFRIFKMHKSKIWRTSSAEQKNCTPNVQLHVRSIYFMMLALRMCLFQIMYTWFVIVLFCSKSAALVVQLLWREVFLRYEHQRNCLYDMGHVNLNYKVNNVWDLLWTKVSMKKDRYIYFLMIIIIHKCLPVIF